MNKTEKLLAARKKLKEFQQHKQSHNHNQEAAPPIVPQDNNTTPEPTKNDQTDQIVQKIHEYANNTPDMENSMKDETLNPNEHTSIFHDDSKNKENERSIASTVDQNSQPSPPEVPEHPQPSENAELSSNILDAFKLPEKNENDIFSQLSSLQNGNSRSENGSQSDSPSLQKQHLLQMASDVANALGENENDTESIPIHSDLEYRNQFLTTCLEEQKRLVNQLHIQVSQYSSRVSELEALLSTKDAEFEAKLLRELNPLKEQLKVHAQTTGILVAEKAELTSAINQYQSVAQQKSEEVEELCGKLKNSHGKISELERELSTLKTSTEDTRKNFQQLQNDYSHLERKYNELKKDKEEQQLETAELRQDLNLKNTELSNLHRELSEKKNLLSLAELKIQQLTNAPNEMQALEGQHQAQTVLEQQLSQLRETLKAVNTEKEETSKHYENYVKQLDGRYERVVQELEEAKRKLSEYEQREESFIQRLSVMEQQYQREKQKVESLLPLQAHEERISHLTKSLDSLVLEQEALQATIRARDTEIESMREELRHLRELRDQNVESVKLVSALESEQLGASRAVSQNQQLKAQLEEMHDAFVMLSNSKLDLTEQLQGERSIGRKLNAELNRIETERDELREELKRKDAVIDELEKDKLQSAQIADQMQHYQAQSGQARTLQQELQNTLNMMETLKRENQALRAKLNSPTSESGEAEINSIVNGERESEKVNADVVDLVKQKMDSEVQTSEDRDNEILSEPLKKLEVRFKETMEKVAELTDEKQKLEHLVLQLQGETETIGEYITLYQKQRAILQKKAQEREQTFRQLIEQRNQQQIQLHQLKVLVADLLKSQTSDANIVPNEEAPSVPNFHTHEHEVKNSEPVEKPPSDVTRVDAKEETTAKILDLLTEIKDCKDTCSLEPNFHPCLWCSGKLITV